MTITEPSESDPSNVLYVQIPSTVEKITEKVTCNFQGTTGTLHECAGYGGSFWGNCFGQTSCAANVGEAYGQKISWSAPNCNGNFETTVNGIDESITFQCGGTASTTPSDSPAQPAASTLKADFNNNGCVDQSDFRRLLRYARGSASYKSKYSQSEKARLDLNSDGNVDNADIQAFSQFNGNGCVEAIQQIMAQQQGSGAVQTPASTAATPSPQAPAAMPAAASSAQPSGSCQNSCGAKSKTGACYCDDYSVTNKGDYCADIASQCPNVWNNPKNKFKQT